MAKGVITADAGSLIEGLPGQPGGVGLLVTEGDMLKNVVWSAVLL